MTPSPDSDRAAFSRRDFLLRAGQVGAALSITPLAAQALGDVRREVPMHVFDGVPLFSRGVDVLGRQLEPAELADNGQACRDPSNRTARAHGVIIWNAGVLCKPTPRSVRAA